MKIEVILTSILYIIICLTTLFNFNDFFLLLTTLFKINNKYLYLFHYYSTVTDFAKFLGLSTSQPFSIEI